MNLRIRYLTVASVLLAITTSCGDSAQDPSISESIQPSPSPVVVAPSSIEKPVSAPTPKSPYTATNTPKPKSNYPDVATASPIPTVKTAAPTAIPQSKSSPLPSTTSKSSSKPPIESTETLISIASGSMARYLVQEQLARLNVPNDAIGSTSNVEGYIKFDPDGAIQKDNSRIRVDLRTIRSDKTTRDQYVQKNTFESDTFPYAEFAVTATHGLQWPLPESGNASFQLTGDMTIHGITAPLTWDMAISILPEGATGQATTSFPFHTFNMAIPKLFFILSVEDNIRLEMDLILDIVTDLEPGAAPPPQATPVPTPAPTPVPPSSPSSGDTTESEEEEEEEMPVY